MNVKVGDIIRVREPGDWVLGRSWVPASGPDYPRQALVTEIGDGELRVRLRRAQRLRAEHGEFAPMQVSVPLDRVYDAEAS